MSWRLQLNELAAWVRTSLAHLACNGHLVKTNGLRSQPGLTEFGDSIANHPSQKQQTPEAKHELEMSCFTIP
jgi:hypothetical protein